MNLELNKIHQGDSLQILQSLDPETIDLVVTSPPYWALRDYGIAGQVGLEPDFNAHIERMISIFSEIKRVLKKSGSCWINYGDTFNGNKVGNTQGMVTHSLRVKEGTNDQAINKQSIKAIPNKSLLMIPERFAIAMIDKGWILRSKIIWHKPNAMPQSAKDRFTIDYEHFFFFTKSQRYYFETQYEPYKWTSLERAKDGIKFGGNKASGYGRRTYSGKEWKPKMGGGGSSFRNDSGNLKSDGTPISNNPRGRIKRSVWSIPTKSFKEAHFATYPEQLIQTPIKACCQIEGVVLDPFMGAGTTALVALKNARNFIGIELNPEYIKIANKRLSPYLSQKRLEILN